MVRGDGERGALPLTGECCRSRLGDLARSCTFSLTGERALLVLAGDLALGELFRGAGDLSLRGEVLLRGERRSLTGELDLSDETRRLCSRRSTAGAIVAT